MVGVISSHSGKMLAERLARTLEYPCINRDKLVKIAAGDPAAPA